MMYCTPIIEPTHLLYSESLVRRDRDLEYLMSLKNDNLLLSHYFEAGIGQMPFRPEGIHWGWDSPLSHIRGTFCGHWLSAAAHLYREIKDEQLLAKANTIVREIARCQESNGGKWAFPIPEKYLYRLKEGHPTWAPQYVCHKNMMGLLDMYSCTENQLALDIVKKCADWFLAFTDDISRETMDEMMDMEETGGLMEFWADLYAVTGDPNHLLLMERYERPRLAEPLLHGVDMLTNMHANATIPEIHGYARAYEVTGKEYYRQVVEAYWDLAVCKRGMYATGSQTSGEVWSPMGQLRARLGDKNQEHCVVYNMMRLANYLFRWTGDSQYADYWEKNLYNGIFAQGFWQDDTVQQSGGSNYPDTTTVAYYLPLKQGSKKRWGAKTNDFYCCHCTLVQANAIHHENIFYRRDHDLYISQYIPAETVFSAEGGTCKVRLEKDERTGHMMRDSQANRMYPSRPASWCYTINLQSDSGTAFDLCLRIPDWCMEYEIAIDGEAATCCKDSLGFVHLHHAWVNQTVTVCLHKALKCVALPDDDDMVAFVDGPVCLAGLVGEEHLLYGDKDHPQDSLLKPSDEREWQSWRSGWKTHHQPFGIEFVPLYQIGHEQYTVYFPVQCKTEGKK